MNPSACESSRSQLSHAQGFRSKSLTVASEYSFEIINILENSEISPEMTAFSSEKLKGERDHSWSSRKQSILIQCMDENASACEGSRSQLSHAQEFKSKSCMVAPEYLIENVEICGKFSKISPNIEFLTRNIPISVPIFSNLWKYADFRRESRLRISPNFRKSAKFRDFDPGKSQKWVNFGRRAFVREFRFEISRTFENEQNLVSKFQKCADFGAEMSQMRKFGRRIHVNIDFC